MMTITDDHLRAPRHHRRRLQPGVEHAALRPPHHAPARLRRELPGRSGRARARQARPRLQHQLVHERARSAPTARSASSTASRRRACTWTLRAEMDVLVLISNCPQINNPCNGFDPTPVRSVEVDPRDRLDGRARLTRGASTAGRSTTVQDLPGRVGLLARRRAAERADGRPRPIGWPTAWSGNPAGAAALELTGAGPTLRFDGPAVVAARRGGDAGAPSTGARCRRWTPVDGRRPGPSCTIGAVDGPGLRATLARPRRHRRRALPRAAGRRSRWAASAAHDGRALAGRRRAAGRRRPSPAARPALARRRDWRRCSTTTWELGVLVGPHTAPEFLTADGPRRAAARPRGRSTSTRPAPACAWSGPARGGPGPTAARPGCTRRTSTTPATPSAPSTSPVTCPSSSARTGRASGGFVCPAVGGGGRALEARPARARATAVRLVPWTPAEAADADDATQPTGWPGRPTRIEPVARPVVERAVRDGTARRRRGARRGRRRRRRPPRRHLPPGRRPVPARRVRGR